jgi:alkylation response protein AidB-like acyl-CoA dehydrogenase
MSLNYDLTAEQNILRQSVREFAEKEIRPVARELDAREEFSYDLTAKMGQMGLFGIIVSPEYGGSGLDYVSYIIAVEEIARVDGSQAATIAAGNSLGIGPIYYFGNEEQKRRWLPRLCTGEILAGFGLTEPQAGSDAGSSRTRAVRDGEEWVLNGSKIFITNAATDITGVIVVQAVTGKKSDGRNELSCFLVPADTPGLVRKAMHGKLMWRSSNTAELYFDDVRLPPDALLGRQGDGFRQMLTTLDGGRLSIGAMGLGGAQGAFELALRYAQERKQFGQPIFDFQAVHFKLADMATEIEAARTLLYKACWLKDNGRPFGKLAAMGKLYCSEVMGRVVSEAVQIHGGYGLMQEYDVERFFRDQKLLTIGEGTSEIQRVVISRHLKE